MLKLFLPDHIVAKSLFQIPRTTIESSLKGPKVEVLQRRWNGSGLLQAWKEKELSIVGYFPFDCGLSRLEHHN